MKINKARVNLFLDLLIGLSFLVEAVSGYVLAVVLPHGGYQGGRNPFYGAEFILTRDQWLWLHDWFAVVMVAGVLAHVALHWRWIVCMFRNLWHEASAKPAPRQEAQECPTN
ncbi:MAG: DUF4405 domain-containing protein [Chloroflexi bacterium]|nr:DUF4405 domain-containing protein [Chloroflexota bacterium]